MKPATARSPERERAEADDDEDERDQGIGMHAGTFFAQPAIP